MRLYYLLLGFSILVGLAGQSLLKLGMQRVGPAEIDSAGSALGLLGRAVLTPQILCGGALYGAGFGAWLLVLSRIELSVAYPMLAINYILITVLAWLFFGESLNAYKVTGCLLIAIGVVVLSQGTAQPAHGPVPIDPAPSSASEPAPPK